MFAKRRAVVFVHGCFWHRHDHCALAYVPKSRKAEWQEKFRRNQQRDQDQLQQLRATGWRVLIVWECALRATAERARSIRRAIDWIVSDSIYAEISRGS